MKKIAAMLLAIALMLSLAACGGDEKTSADSEVSEESDTAADNSADTESTESDSAELEEVSFEEVTVVDNDQCTIKITGLDPENMWGYTVDVSMENKSADKTYMFSLTEASVNGVKASPWFAEEIAAGKKSNGEISFTDENLTAQEIGDFTDIELSFNVYDSEDWSADSVATETVHIYPYGEENASLFVREQQPTDTILVDNDDVSVIVTGYDEEGFWGYTVNMYIVNKTDKELTYSADDVSVNGYMADPLWATTIGAGKVEFSSISWLDSDFEEIGITTVEEIEMRLNIYDPNDWSADAILDEVVTLNP